jgi:hypothetical protein
MTIQRNGEDLEIDVTGKGYGPEYDVGIMGRYFEDIFAKDRLGNEVELTEDEEAIASELLAQAEWDDFDTPWNE